MNEKIRKYLKIVAIYLLIFCILVSVSIVSYIYFFNKFNNKKVVDNETVLTVAEELDESEIVVNLNEAEIDNMENSESKQEELTEEQKAELEKNKEEEEKKKQDEIKKKKEELAKKQAEEIKNYAVSYNYYLKVNYTANTVTAYAKDTNGNFTVPVRAMVCSTGTATPTSGVYKTLNKYRWKLLIGNSYGQYSTRITGQILFHSVPYEKQSEDSLITRYYDRLGITTSMGCIRLTVEDAKWIYDNCPLGTAVEFYASSNPGPLGKPSAKKITDYGYPLNRWDPTDPNVNNPWKNKQVTNQENNNNVKDENNEQSQNTTEIKKEEIIQKEQNSEQDKTVKEDVEEIPKKESDKVEKEPETETVPDKTEKVPEETSEKVEESIIEKTPENGTEKKSEESFGKVDDK